MKNLIIALMVFAITLGVGCKKESPADVGSSPTVKMKTKAEVDKHPKDCQCIVCKEHRPVQLPPPK